MSSQEVVSVLQAKLPEDMAKLRTGEIDHIRFSIIATAPLPSAKNGSSSAVPAIVLGSRALMKHSSVLLQGGIKGSNRYAARAAVLSATDPMPDVTLRLSIMSGRVAQYTIGARTLDFVVACGELDGNNNVVWYPGSLQMDWYVADTFGGHSGRTHTANQPPGRFEWLGQNAKAVGAYRGGGNPNSHPSTTFQIAAGDGASPTLRIYAPETAMDQRWNARQYCTFPDQAYDSGTQTALLRYQMDVSLQYVPDMVSSNGLSVLGIERAVNSHPDAAGYGTSLTAADLSALVERYGTCDTHVAAGGLYPLTATALSLPNGGVYDHTLNWDKPHKNHRAGEDTDIALNGLPQTDLQCLLKAVRKSSLTMPVASESIKLDADGVTVVYGPGMDTAHPHIHLWTGEAHQYPLDITSDWPTY